VTAVGAARPIGVNLTAAIVAIAGGGPAVMRIGGKDRQFADALPSGQFDPDQHRTMESGLRRWVAEQTALRLGYVEQLYTFGDRGRLHVPGEATPHVVSVGYLALTRAAGEYMPEARLAGAAFRNWYDFLPWEDWRSGKPAILGEAIEPAIQEWMRKAKHETTGERGDAATRARIAFGLDGSPFDEEHVLDRYELMYSAGLVAESVRDGRHASLRIGAVTGAPMDHDHRRILATAMQRLRAKLKYRPVVFELMAEEFTLTDLQQTVESISGRPAHKQNFRRLVESAQLVEPTGASRSATGGRPAALFRFRREVLLERPSPGLKIGRRG
jgi:hypothetical protein